MRSPACRAVRRAAAPPLVAMALCGAGCSWMWPTVVPTSPGEPLFHTGFPLVGGMRLDGPLCSLVSLGPDATRVVSKPESTDRALPLELACQHGLPAPAGGDREAATLVRVDTSRGAVDGYLFATRPASGLAVVFSGLGMPADGWINERFARACAQRGLVAFAPVREEPHPIWFDPLREARRAIEAADRIATECLAGPPGHLGFLGVSLGGLEALLANREALARGMATRAVVLDPVLDVRLATANLDGFWHGLAVDSVQGYFRRILTGRYREDPPPKFQELMERTASHPEAESDLGRDSPSTWLCGARRDAYVVYLSASDEVLGDGQRDFAEACGFPLRKLGVPGHTPLACRLELFDEMVEDLRLGGRSLAADAPPR